MAEYVNKEEVLEHCEALPKLYREAMRLFIKEIPSVNIVRCKECKHSEYREEFDDYECHSSGCGLVYDADFFCGDGEVRDE